MNSLRTGLREQRDLIDWWKAVWGVGAVALYCFLLVLFVDHVLFTESVVPGWILLGAFALLAAFAYVLKQRHVAGYGLVEFAGGLLITAATFRPHWFLASYIGTHGQVTASTLAIGLIAGVYIMVSGIEHLVDGIKNDYHI